MLRPLLLLVPVMACSTVADAASLAFRAPVHLRSYAAGSVAVADFNGDGRDDLAFLDNVLYGSPLRLKVSLQSADGSLAAIVTYELSGASAVGTVVQADLGADGTREILVGHDNGLAVFRWNGAGGFSRTDHPAGSMCGNIATGDIDGDGAPDVVCIGDEAGATLFYSDPATGLSAPSYMQTAATGAVRLKDVTGDGKPDLLLASSTSNSFFIYPHDGTRGFLPAVAYPYPEEAFLWSFAIEAMDLDGDAANEVLVATPCNTPCAALYTYRKGMHGYMELSQRVPTLDSPETFLSVDIDGNGYEDLLVGHAGWSTVGRYMGNGQGLPSTELWSSVPTQNGNDTMAVGDLNHDGFPDLAVANSFGVSLLYGGRRAVSDFNDDFQSDLVWRNTATGQNQLWIAADSTRAQDLPGIDPAWSIQAISDFDGDGQADLFWRNATTGVNEILSAGTTQTVISLASQDWQVAGAGDFDGDSRSDVLWRNTHTGVNTIWKSGDSATPQSVTSVTDQGWKVAGVGDFDADGRSDILWRHATTGNNVIWRAGRSDMSQAVMAIGLQWKVAGVGDFNGDRKDDVAWRNTSTGANAIWLSANGAAGIAVSTVADQAWTVAAVGDYNGDGRADLMWRNGSTGANVIWRSGDSRNAQVVTAISGWTLAR